MEALDGARAVLRADGLCSSSDDSYDRKRLGSRLRTGRVALCEMQRGFLAFGGVLTYWTVRANRTLRNVCSSRSGNPPMAGYRRAMANGSWDSRRGYCRAI